MHQCSATDYTSQKRSSAWAGVRARLREAAHQRWASGATEAVLRLS